MKKTLRMISLLMLAMFSIPTFAGIIINETFETGMPTSAPTSDVSVTLSSGVWVINNVYGKTDGGSKRAAMKTNGYVITPAVNSPSKLTFNHRGSGSGKILTIQKSVAGGSWVSIGTVSVSSASAYGSSSFAVNETSSNVRIRFICGSATIYIDNVVIEASEATTEPTVQAAISASNITGSSVTINITAGNGQGRLLAYRKSASVSWVPVDGASYTAGTAVDSYHTIAFVGTAPSTVVSGLEAGATYYFAVFEYNGSGSSINYLTSTPGTVQITTLQLPTIAASPLSLNFGSKIVGSTTTMAFALSAQYLTPASGNITVTGTGVFTVSLQQTSGFSGSLTIPYTSGTLASTQVYVQFAPTANESYSGNLTVSGGGASRAIAVSGTGSSTSANVYYISPSGNDANSGSISSPLKNLQVAVNKMQPGDTVVLRGGVYYPDYMQDGTKTTVRLSALGTAQKRLCIVNYSGESPILNFRDQPRAVSVRGIQLNGDYWYIKGIHITQAGDNGMKIEGNHNTIEKCSFSYNDDSGLQLGFGHSFSDSHPGISSNDGSYCAYNDIIDCDAYFNYDTDNRGSDADGFACKMHNGLKNRFIRCRAWDNSDDAWDLYETDYPVYLIECWAWGSGRASNFNVVGGSFQGNGNGIKLGGNGTGGSSKGKHEAWYCIAFNNNKTGSVKGFDQNSHGGGIKLVNCLAFGNGYDYMFETASGVREFYNNVCFGNIEIASGATQGNNASIKITDEGWTNNVCSTFSTSDYISLTESDAKLPRGADGSMPTSFARLVNGSVLIDKGTVVPNSNAELNGLGLPWAYTGLAPDLGPYEKGLKSAPALQIIVNPKAALEVSAYPNPILDYGTLKLSVNRDVSVSVSIYNIRSTKVQELQPLAMINGVEYYIPLDMSGLPNGIYTVLVNAGGEITKCKVLVQK